MSEPFVPIHEVILKLVEEPVDGKQYLVVSRTVSGRFIYSIAPFYCNRFWGVTPLASLKEENARLYEIPEDYEASVP